jgi:Mg/Co/Ni transporter MgtE
MDLDFVAVPMDARVADGLEAVKASVGFEPESLTSVHVLDTGSKLCGVVKLVELLQADPERLVSEIYDDDPVRVGADTDMVDVAVLMSDYNLITIPVVDERRVMIGLITVDDVLDVALPDDWRRREAAEPPDSRHGQRT